jgi:molybdate transport system permease protein
MDWTALAVSLRLGAWTTLVLLVVGVPLAAWLATTRFRLRFVVEAVVALPLVLPPTVLGFYLLVALGPAGPLGAAYEQLAGRILPFSFAGLVIASSIHSLPFMVQPVTAAFTSVDRKLVEAAYCLGSSRAGAFARVVLPLSIRGLVTGAILTFAHTLGEFGVVLMVGGNIPGVTRTASIAIYDHTQALDYAAAGWTSLVLLAVSFAVLVTTYALQGRHLSLARTRA